MTSDPTSSVTSVGYAVRGVRPSSRPGDIGAPTLAQTPEAAEPSAQLPVRNGGKGGYSDTRGQSERGRIVNFKV